MRTTLKIGGIVFGMGEMIAKTTTIGITAIIMKEAGGMTRAAWIQPKYGEDGIAVK
ncbi:hypothetical protein [Neobacillus terrae]|uniref:hypothetical protein n=1 Tax=Neobacillus terrae TaxID=3034837 RepID=UPI00140DC762|nr:hypothetical protein [Neobacillus terrae]NHM29295.1 hypothetical protein [Neobacillus terrae]